MAPVALFLFSLLTHLVVLHSAERCPWNFFCNKMVGNIGFPFRSKAHPPECGLYTVDCSAQPLPRIQLKKDGYWHEFVGPLSTLIHINDQKLRERYEKDSCDDELFDALSLPIPSLELPQVLLTFSLTLFKCNHTLDHTSYAHLKHGCSNGNYTYYTLSENHLPSPPPPSPPPCSIIQIPLDPNQPPFSLSAWAHEFFLRAASQECFQCHVRNGDCLYICSTAVKVHVAGDNKSTSRLAIASAGAVAGLMVLVVIIFFRRKKSQNRQIVEAFPRSYGPLQVRKYSYLKVKKMTNSFKEKLGQGGYGCVYKGKFKDGCLVAVKVLNKSKGNGEEFMNEVAAVSRTSHVNVVTLLGFCFEGSKRALIYEFMPNGSLEKFIFDANNPKKEHHLGWEELDLISLGIARGLEYLHRGCNTRILHFDIKPHNILLDENFTPKISDFGLAKICDRKESFVSMLGARGTAGYIAPEVFCRNFGTVSHKSDVYSYGMMLSEIVGGRRNINAEAENTSEIYFPHWIYKRLELDEELGLQSIMSKEDEVSARKMIIVSLWCIQTDPSNRPAMKEVVDMLEGSVDSLQIPPKPYLSSPPRKSLADPSTTLVSLQ